MPQRQIAAGTQVHLRSDRPDRPWYDTDELVTFNCEPCVYQVTSVVPAHDVQVTGGTARMGDQVKIRPADSRSGLEWTVPADRVVPVDAPLRPHP